jgi:glycosidase
LAAALLFSLAQAAAQATAQATDYRDRLVEDEIIYFLLPDRFDNADPANDHGGLAGDRLQTGFDPTDPGFYHGGDLQGVLRRLDYIQGLGATALWIAPVFVNKPVQGAPAAASAAYHGYWITDFTHVDPHFGTDDDFRALVDAAHTRGMKVYLDIVVNHTADVIRYRECPQGACPYRSKADYPYSRRGGVGGPAINEGFLGDDAPHQTAENFAHLTRSDFAYTPFVPAAEAKIKHPDWLNDPIYYHNRGESTFQGESSTDGDFGGLDDLMTENPRVIAGFIEIYGAWIDRYGIDGYRIDTARHVNPEFWRAFVPAMMARARARGVAHFAMFGEVQTPRADVALLARHTRVDGLPAVLDFAFAAALRNAVSGRTGTDALARVFADDALYEGGAAAALCLPTFTGNHDDGRLGALLLAMNPAPDPAETLQRALLGNAMLLTLRGVPVLYYGDEQGFAGGNGDRGARQDMFATQAPQYRDEARIGPRRAAPPDAFWPEHPLYAATARLARMRLAQTALRRGEQVVRADSPGPGLLAVSRREPETGREIVLAFNTATHPVEARIAVDVASGSFESLAGTCDAQVLAPGSYRVVVPALSYLVCAAVPAGR